MATSGIDFLAAQADEDLQLARRAFAVAQAGLAGASLRIFSEVAEVSWHDTSTHPETGCIALVREDEGLADLVGEIVKVSRTMPTTTRVVYAYVLGTAPIADDISLSRRTFMGLGILANELLTCRVDVVA